MTMRMVIVIALAALIVGFGAGFALRPILTSSTSAAASLEIARPSQGEAIAAVRRFKVGFDTYSSASLTLGDCSPGASGLGVTCMTRVTLRPKSPTQNRAIGFAQVDGRWEVSHW